MSGGWNTIESDAGVFTYLVESLGVSELQFEELLSLDSESLQSHAPVYGVIFLFKYPTNEPSSTDLQDGTYDHSATSDLFFARQVIQNACATQAILSILLNKASTISLGPTLTEFLSFTSSFPPDLRGEALSNSSLIRSVHNEFSRSSPFVDEGTRAATEDDDVYHFIAYAPINGVLYELDGLQPAPISHGPCEDDEFTEKIVPVLQRRMQRYPLGEIRFNLMAVAKDPRVRAREIGDFERIQEEERKREMWKWENELRRHNFVGFVHEVTKRVIAQKRKEGGEEALKEWIKEAREKGKRKKGGEDEMDIE